MTDGKVSAAHLRRKAVIYVRQSSASQLERNKESTERQYALADRAAALGWPRSAVHVIDADLGVSGAVTSTRSGFAELTAQVALGEIGLVLALEVSRLARSNSDWYRLLDVAYMTDTLIGDADGLYHPGLFNDRMLLGLKGTMSEAELHVLRARLDGGIRNKAARGELRRALPVGLAWGEEEGEILLHPDEAVTGVIAAIFARFAECGSARATWLWLREQGLSFPLQRTGEAEIRWVVPTYHAVHKVLTHPAYAGCLRLRKNQTRAVPRRQRPTPHPGPPFAPRPVAGPAARPPRRVHRLADLRGEPGPHRAEHPPRPPRSRDRRGPRGMRAAAGPGRLRSLRAQDRGPLPRQAPGHPGYHCHGAELVAGRGQRCLTVGGVQIDAAVAGAFLAAIEPAALEACLAAADELETGHDTALAQWRREVERARFQAAKAERRYLAVDPDNRLVARGLEAEWERTLTALAAAEAELTRRETRRPTTLTVEERAGVLALGDDLPGVWHAPTTTDRDRKEVLHTLLEEVVISLDRHSKRADLTLRWKGGALTDLTVALPRSQPPKVRTSDDTVDLVRRLAVHYPDAVIAGILNRQGRTTARGLPFDYNRVNNLRNHWKIPRHRPDDAPPADEPEPLSIKQAAKELEVAPSTLHRWLNDGFIAGEQITPGAPWRIRLTDDLRSRFTDQAPPGWLPMLEATLALGVSRQTVLQRVKRGELEAVHVRSGRRKGLRIKLPVPADSLF